MSDDDDLDIQQEEVESIKAIYGDLVEQDSPSRITVKFDYDVRLVIDFPFDYPSSSPPTFEVGAPLLSSAQKQEISEKLQEIYLNNLGQQIIYQWINAVIEYLANSDLDKQTNQSTSSDQNDDEVCPSPLCPEVVAPPIASGEVLCDRKSVFQGHVAPIKSKDEAFAVLRALKENSKIARATHASYAYLVERMVNNKLVRESDCEDDGEDGAGSKLLDLLELMKAKNVIVIVTRWYGGIHLGPDRFRHIRNVAREVLLENGFSNR
uniref:RWD domain-containing protein n=1 Tax=Syphacia muris TaxID=451379 RepID=A0A0N5ASF4_9BILA